MLDLLYPPACHLCNVPLEDGNYICQNCDDSLLLLEQPYCKTCAEPFEGNIGADFECPNCHKLNFHFDFARAALQNTENAHTLIHDLKYKHQLHLAPILAKPMAALISHLPELSELPSPVLVSVPLHWRKKMKRSFNQSDKIGRALSELTRIPLAHPLKRKKNTDTQTSLSREKRLKNLDDAFTFTQLTPKYSSAIIIDDVLTTGSTANACAKTLREHCPNLENIVVLTAMRG